MRVPSAVDWWLRLLLYGAVAVSLGAAATATGDDRIPGISISLAMSILLLWILHGTWYELREDHLHCRCGPFGERIPYDRIKSLRLVTSPLSSMALSLQRIEIRQHGRGWITGTTMISPVDREDFLRQLATRCRNLESRE
ncbi:PH domain-containing protein [Anaerotalea alkaliphila]|uniref:PH domain-containing protein n=1 Tax=Anaerotalea alkaliphila TaxID=2662126 RepID=A0A7X5HU11_9FIRM|nr:PH domain-containing protein [Anaerotalea alkaliphila]NDL66652.1 PH domain-containing protein [Anaerotalea alkaliphila]